MKNKSDPTADICLKEVNTADEKNKPASSSSFLSGFVQASISILLQRLHPSLPPSLPSSSYREVVNQVIMDSSNASNSCTTPSTCGSLLPSSSTQTKDPPTKDTPSKDIAWQWGECRNPNYPTWITCLLCLKEICGGGITRLKDHILQKSGNVKPCGSATTDIMNKLNQETSLKRTRKEIRATVDLLYEHTNSDDWWITYGGRDVRCLQKFAIKVLSLTCSSSPCERNWSTFQNLHSNKRNCLTQHKLNDSVFIQYNKKLQRRYKEIQQYNDDGKARDPIFLEEHDEWLDPQNLDDLNVEGDNVTLDDLQENIGEVSGSVRSSRSKSIYRTDTDIDAYDTDQLMLDTERGLLGDDCDDIYNESNDFD